jgi:hypothetical protein
MVGQTHYNGTICGICGVYVPFGVTHACSTSGSPVTRTDWTPQLIALGNRVADLLERLVAALEEREP